MARLGRSQPFKPLIKNTKSVIGWQYYRSITIDHTKVSSTQTDFPVLVSGTYSYLATVANSGTVTNANGYDIAFFSDSALTTQLSHETEKYVATTGEVVYWVKVSSVSSSVDTVIYMAYDNSSISTDQSNKTAVWDTNYKGVWHLPNGTSLTALDSTSNANNGTVNSGTAGTGKIDGAASFAASGNGIDTGAGASLNIVNNLTISQWVNFSSVAANQVSLSKGTQASMTNWHIIYVAGAAAGQKLYFGIFGGNTSLFGTDPSTSTWYYLTVTLTTNGSNTDVRTYFNGSLINTYLNVGALTSVSGKNMLIGQYADAAQNIPFNGLIDETRVSNSVRSTGWITTEYNNQVTPSTFYTVGSQVATGNVTTTQTITGVSRVTANTTKTETGVARITATTTKTETGVARVQVTTTKTITGVSRITANATKTETGVARITATATKTETGVARITVTTTKTETGVARITATTTKTETGVSRITVNATKTITGISRITATTTKTETGLARITSKTNRTITGTARVGTALVSRVKVWTGSAWVVKTVKVWSGSAWVTKTLKIWNGSSWI